MRLERSRPDGLERVRCQRLAVTWQEGLTAVLLTAVVWMYCLESQLPALQRPQFCSRFGSTEAGLPRWLQNTTFQKPLTYR